MLLGLGRKAVPEPEGNLEGRGVEVTLTLGWNIKHPTLDQFWSTSPTIPWLGEIATVPFPSSCQSLLAWLLRLSLPLGLPAASVLTAETQWSWVALPSPAPSSPYCIPQAIRNIGSIVLIPAAQKPSQCFLANA